MNEPRTMVLYMSFCFFLTMAIHRIRTDEHIQATIKPYRIRLLMWSAPLRGWMQARWRRIDWSLFAMQGLLALDVVIVSWVIGMFFGAR